MSGRIPVARRIYAIGRGSHSLRRHTKLTPLNFRGGSFYYARHYTGFSPGCVPPIHPTVPTHAKNRPRAATIFSSKGAGNGADMKSGQTGSTRCTSRLPRWLSAMNIRECIHENPTKNWSRIFRQKALFATQRPSEAMGCTRRTAHCRTTRRGRKWWLFSENFSSKGISYNSQRNVGGRVVLTYVPFADISERQ